MSNRVIANIFILLLIAWMIGCTYCYVCKIMGHCDGKETTEKITEEKASIPGLSITDGKDLNISNPENIYFDYKGSALMVEKNLIPSIKELVEYLKNHPDKNLVVTGKYLEEEGGSDLGLDRARSLMNHLSINYGIDSMRVKRSFKLVDNLVVDKDLNRTYGALDFDFNIDRAKVVDAEGENNEEEDLDQLKVELAKVRTVYFDHASSNMKTDPALHQFFTDLKYYVGKRTDAKVSLVGHTDNTGTTDANQKLSVARCNDVESFLIANHSLTKGDFAKQGMGERKPIASNDTEKGRAENRRVEISLKH